MEMATVSLMAHSQGNHSVGQGVQWRLHPPPPPFREECHTHRVSLMSALMRLVCSVEGFQGGTTIWENLRFNFVQSHVRDIIVILEEDSQSYPRCPKYDMLVSQ